MAAYAAVASLMNNIEQIMNHPCLSTSFDNQLLQSLLQKAASLLDFIQSYDNGGMMSEEAEDLERTIARAAHAAEDVIETHIVDQIHLGTAEVSPSCSLNLQQGTEFMDAILKKAHKLKKQGRLREEEQPAHSTTPMAMEAEEEKKTAMVGFEEELIQILDVLTNTSSSSRHVISIVGMGGVGKTTLAQNIYQHLLIKQHFYIRAWATVSQKYNLKTILSQLLLSIGGSLSQLLLNVGGSSSQKNKTGGSLSQKKKKDESGYDELHRYLFGRRYLIILDDIWSVEAWDEVSRYFPDNGNGSRVVLTTRSSTVARNCCSSFCFTMKPLDEDTSWKLFCKKAFEQETCPYPELKRVGKEIVRLCRGLPLSTVVIGGLLLNSPRSLQLWEKVVSNMKSNPNSKEKEESLDILSLSYSHLPPHLKPCFLYMGVFREDSEISVSKIIKLWVGEGFLRPASNRGLEEIAEGYLKELIDRNLIFVKEHGKNGKIKSCGIHDLVRDLSLKVGQKQEFFHLSTREMLGTERRIIYRREPSLAPFFFRGCFMMLDDHKLVRVCDDAYVKSTSIKYEKVNLRYIHCIDTIFTRFDAPGTMQLLPSSISFIWNLQTLIVHGTKVVVAPIEIWKMRQLRHIKCGRISLPDPLPSDGFVMMDNLQTLKGAEGLRHWKQVFEIIPNIKKLCLSLNTRNMSKCYWYLGCLNKLQSLSLSFRGRITKLRNTLTLPISLNKLHVDRCPLEAEDLWMIGSLPQLQVLELKSVILNNKFSFIEGQFLRLKFLELSYFDLRHLCADSSQFPVLEKLFLKFLDRLEEIPSSIGEIPTLELICVDGCSDSAAISAIRIKQDQLENQGNDALQVQVKIVRKLESFVELVEREGLTIDNIHLKSVWG